MSPATSAPDPDVVNVTFHGVVAFARYDVGAKLTALNCEPVGWMATTEVGEVGVGSSEVTTAKSLPTYVEVAGGSFALKDKAAGTPPVSEQPHGNVTVKVEPDGVTAWGAQLFPPVKPRAKVTVVGEDSPKEVGIVTVTVSPLVKNPGVVGVKLAVHVVVVLAAYVLSVKETPVTAVPGGVVIVSGVVVVPKTVLGSSEVVTSNVEYVPAAGLVTPGMVSIAAVPLPTEQLEPARAIVSVDPDEVPVAVHDENPWSNVMVDGPTGNVNPAGKVTEIVSPATSAPPYGGAPVVGRATDVVKATDQGWVMDAGWLPGVLTPVTFEPEYVSGETVPEIGVVSTLVDTVKDEARYEASVTGGFVIPVVNSTYPTVGLVSVQPDGRVMVTDVPNVEDAVPVVLEQAENPVSEKPGSGELDTRKPLGKVAVIVSPAARAVVGVKPTCQSETWFAYASFDVENEGDACCG